MEDREQSLRDFINSIIENKVMQKTDLASALGYDRAMIYKFTRNDGRVSDKFLNAVEDFKKKYEETNGQTEEQAAAVQPVEKVKESKCSIGRADSECIGGYFRWTRDARNVFGFCKATKDKAKLSAILGKAGSGKTKSLQEFAYHHEDVIYIRCMKIWKKRHIFKKIADKVGLVLTGTDEDDNFEQLIEHLLQAPKMIIFDEFDHLITQKSTAKIEVIRDLYDFTKTGGTSIIIAGSPILKYILTKRTSTDNYGQIDSRVYFTYEMQDLKKDEVIELLEDYEMTQDAKELLIEKTMDCDNGKGRYLEFAINKCLDLSAGQIITKKHILGATKLAIVDMN